MSRLDDDAEILRSIETWNNETEKQNSAQNTKLKNGYALIATSKNQC